MAIRGIDRLTVPEVLTEVRRGGRFVRYEYCISPIVVTMKRSSDIYLIRAGQSAVLRGLPFVAVSLLFGWWGFPFGPIFTAWAVGITLTGGNDVTSMVVARLAPLAQPRPGQVSGRSTGQDGGGSPNVPGYAIRLDQPPPQRK